MHPSVRFTSALPYLGRFWRRVVDAELARFDISEALAAPLVQIARAGGGITQVELAERLGIRGPALVRVLDRLAEQDLIDRRTDPNDRRANRLHLTAKGEDLSKRIEETISGLRDQILSSISPDEIEACNDVLDRFAAILERHERARAEEARRP